SALVVTRDGQVVAGRRSARVIAFGGHVHPFGGMLESVRDGRAAVDVFESMRRELREELALADCELAQLQLHGFIVDPAIAGAGLLFPLQSDLTLAQLAARWQPASSRDEHDELVAVPDDARLAAPRLARLEPLTAVAHAAFELYFAP